MSADLVDHFSHERTVLAQLWVRLVGLEPTVTLGEFQRPSEQAAAPKERHAVEEALGFRVEPLTPQMAQQYELDRTSGIVISDISPFSGAAEAGVRPGIIVEAINGQEVRSVADVERIAATVKPGSVVSLRGYTKTTGDLIINYRARR